ncbi:hypothetical protein I8752_36510 [Nostocaceae cyanobacterium CENA369]|uniref:Uncharacterized protein n=1 Tax=Dendronalium phyllosphericum CENA369 TaxID=1725256 RepID=A0A8J7LQV1_9NOST|nr:hypothetical protein [Dendronalium phyllosphericum]MBH8578349.1 hypothetical protein [Dendronalium phyllosphericum CENA369]
MSNPVLQLENSQNWESVYTTTVEAVVSANGESYTPIPTITIPVLLDKHIIAVSVTCSTAKPTWYFGGFLNQRINLGLLVGGLPDSDAVQKRKIWLNRITLIIFPELTSTYSLSLDVPKWFQYVSFTVFKYVGIESDTTENLINQIINVDLPRIEQKVNDISNYGA